jgi:hypothetical protein
MRETTGQLEKLAVQVDDFRPLRKTGPRRCQRLSTREFSSVMEFHR